MAGLDPAIQLLVAALPRGDGWAAHMLAKARRGQAFL